MIGLYFGVARRGPQNCHWRVLSSPVQQSPRNEWGSNLIEVVNLGHCAAVRTNICVQLGKDCAKVLLTVKKDGFWQYLHCGLIFKPRLLSCFIHLLAHPKTRQAITENHLSRNVQNVEADWLDNIVEFWPSCRESLSFRRTIWERIVVTHGLKLGD